MSHQRTNKNNNNNEELEYTCTRIPNAQCPPQCRQRLPSPNHSSSCRSETFRSLKLPDNGLGVEKELGGMQQCHSDEAQLHASDGSWALKEKIRISSVLWECHICQRPSLTRTAEALPSGFTQVSPPQSLDRSHLSKEQGSARGSVSTRGSGGNLDLDSVRQAKTWIPPSLLRKGARTIRPWHHHKGQAKAPAKTSPPDGLPDCGSVMAAPRRGSLAIALGSSSGVSRANSPSTSPPEAKLSTKPTGQTSYEGGDREPSVTVRRCVFACIISVVIIAMAVMWVLAMTLQWKGPKRVELESCQTDACRYYASLLAQAVDVEANPCDDLYQFVCGGWLRTESQQVAIQNWEDFLDRSMTSLVKYDSGIDADKSLHDVARYIKACLAPLTRDNVDEVKQVLQAGRMPWPSQAEPRRADFLAAVFYMSRIVYAPVFFDTRTMAVGTVRRLLLFAKDDAYEVTYSNLNTHVIMGRIQEHYRACCQAFAFHGANASRCEQLLEDFVRMKSFLDRNAGWVTKSEKSNNPTYYLRYTPSVPMSRWEPLIKRYLNTTIRHLNGVLIDNSNKFGSVFKAHEHFGEEKMLDLVGWLSVQVLIQYTNIKLINSYHLDSSTGRKEQRKLCFTMAYMAYGHVVDRAILADAQAAERYVEELAEKVRTAFKDALAGGSILRGNPKPEPASVKLNRTFDILKASSSDPQPGDLHGGFSIITDEPLANKMTLTSYLSQFNVTAMNTARPEYILYSAYDSTAFDGFRLNPQHLTAPWYFPGAPAGVLIGGLGVRLAGALFADYVDRSANSSATYADNAQCLDPYGVHEEFGTDVQLATAALGVAWSLYEQSRSSSRPVVPPYPSEDALVFAFPCWLLCGGAERARLLCNTPAMHSPQFARVFNCSANSKMNPKFKCTMRV
ncbi:uncharacterized protein LOC144166629 [Haemaphysalis longicornis]